MKAKATSNQSRWSKGEEDHDPDVEQIVRFPAPAHPEKRPNSGGELPPARVACPLRTADNTTHRTLTIYIC